MKEKDIQNLILDWLQRQRHTYVWRQNSGSSFQDGPTGRHGFRATSVAGVSDILGIWNGFPLAVEVKQPKKKPTENQATFLSNFARAGGIAIVAHGLDELKANLEKIKAEFDITCPYRPDGIFIRNQ